MPCPICITTSLLNALGVTGAMVGIKKLKRDKNDRNGRTEPRKKNSTPSKQKKES